MEALTVQIAKLELKADETLVVMAPMSLSGESMAQLRTVLTNVLPEGTKVLVLDAGITLAKLSAAE